MHERVDVLAGAFVTHDPVLEREFEARLADAPTLAFRVAFSVLRNREDAEDVAQEAIANAFRRFAQLRDRERFRAWLVRATWRLALDHQRAARRRLRREHGIAGETSTPHDEAESSERAARLWRAIDALPEKLRLTLVLSGIEGHDTRDVAALLGIPEGTVKSRLFQARQALRALLS